MKKKLDNYRQDLGIPSQENVQFSEVSIEELIEVIIAENVPAFSFTFGTPRPESIQKLKENRVKKVVIAYGSNYSEQSKAEILKDILTEEGLTVKMIYPKDADTWNQTLLNGMDKEYVNLIIGAEKEYRKQEDLSFKVKKEGLNYIFTVS